MVAKLLFRVFMVLNFECSTHAQTCKLALSGKFVVGCGFLAIGTCKRERESLLHEMERGVELRN